MTRRSSWSIEDRDANLQRMTLANLWDLPSTYMYGTGFRSFVAVPLTTTCTEFWNALVDIHAIDASAG